MKNAVSEKMKTVTENITIKALIEKLSKYDQDETVHVESFGDCLYVTKSPSAVRNLAPIKPFVKVFNYDDFKHDKSDIPRS